MPDSRNQFDPHYANEFATTDEGGLRPPPGLSAWRRAWWWFDFIILVKVARLRFVAVLVVIGVVITQWSTLVAYYERWTRGTASDTAAESGDEFFCPMHPTVVRSSNKEKCPICFMPLSKRKKGSGDDVEPLPAGVMNRVQLSPYRVVLAGVQTWQVGYEPLTKEISTVGYVEFNERGLKNVSARVAGRIDKLLVSETGQTVQAGDELASLYSPDLNVTVQNLLDAKRRGNAELLASARSRLDLLGIIGDQIDEIVRTGKGNTHLRIRSPIAGHIIKKYVREGQYVEEGTPLYDVADLSTVWIQAQIYEDDLAFLPVKFHDRPERLDSGLSVTVTTRAYPNDPLHGTLTFIYPHVDQETRAVTVRFELENPDHKLRPGATATVKIAVPPQSLAALAEIAKSEDPALAEARGKLAQGLVLAVPESAVIDTGNQKIVYRETDPGVYEGVKIELGPRMHGSGDVAYRPLLKGLTAGERIVTSGSFLVDAETRLNPAAGSIYFGGSGGKSAAPATIRPSTPDDEDAKLESALARLSQADQSLAKAQRFCPVLPLNRLGSMGVPIKVTINGEGVLLCCKGCIEDAHVNGKETLAKAKKLKESK